VPAAAEAAAAEAPAEGAGEAPPAGVFVDSGLSASELDKVLAKLAGAG